MSDDGRRIGRDLNSQEHNRIEIMKTAEEFWSSGWKSAHDWASNEGESAEVLQAIRKIGETPIKSWIDHFGR